ncbi:hypothetical protein KHF85_05865 [Xanthomonas translucens pv. graminis]|uniref:hypothetical protein n=1 Tax=Xanthomonas graminis TaxID=3390026 RepID=UPI00253F7B57|nr:hypothetical protein [Xanthomonas translucens]WIH05979.1 hypothetical protein KHF85_05865 [Xanthomonas translucens pv. graminis]
MADVAASGCDAGDGCDTQVADAGRTARIDAHAVVAKCWKATPLQRHRIAANLASVFWQSR